MQVKKIRSCIDHWEKGIPWEETGIFDFLEKEIENHPRNIFDDCGNRKELKKRYARLDRLFETVRAEGGLKTNRGWISGHSGKGTGFIATWGLAPAFSSEE